MDPVTAFGLAVGVLQVVDFSSKALSMCRELYKNGSLAENQSVEEVAKCLAHKADGLKSCMEQAPGPKSQNDRDILDISTKCSKTAAKLGAELQTLLLDSRRGRRQAITKTLRAIRRKDFVKKVQDELKEYEQILDTCILVRLDAHSIQQAKDFQSLDQSVRDLVLQLEKGHKTFGQLVADQGQALRDHIDRRFDKHAEVDRDLQAQKQFKDSLFFPEIESRQEQIPEAYRGTCRWIFNPPNTEVGSSDSSDIVDLDDEGGQSEQSDGYESRVEKEDGDNNTESDRSGREVAGGSSEILNRDGDRSNDDSRSQPWSNFVDWLEFGKGLYWINGKPGSGKSTLMNYLTSEPRTKQALGSWAKDSDLVTPSFFFWNPGTILQKSLVGLLRSLLYQIAEQRPELIPIMMNRETILKERPNEFLTSAQLNTWTEKRLFSVLQRLFDHLPPSISFCFFIDGLDEFVGEEDILIKTLRLLMDRPLTKICASSRPEQIFRQEFQGSAQLRLQDFNLRDIKRTAMSKMRPILNQYFEQDQENTIDDMISEVCHKAQGVFLWLDIMIKDIVTGARNKDTLQELWSRLQDTPDTIEGLYEHMLRKLNKRYLPDATKYFRFLVAASRHSGGRCTLLDFAFAEDRAWEHVSKNDLRYPESPEFDELCDRLDTRIITRCAGLVEIEEYRDYHHTGVQLWDDLNKKIQSLFFAPNHRKERNVCRHLRQVNFIHKTVVEFLDNHRQTFFQEPSWRSAATLALARGQLGSMSIIPLLLPEGVVEKYSLKFHPVIYGVMRTVSAIDLSETIGGIDRAFENVAVEMVNHAYQVVSQVEAHVFGIDRPFHNGEVGTNLEYPISDRSGFAACFGCYSYVSRYVFLHKHPRDELTYLLKCATAGLRPGPRLPYSFLILELLLHQGANSNSSMPFYRCGFNGQGRNNSVWGNFLVCSTWLFKQADILDGITRLDSLWNALVESFLSCAADVNSSIFSEEYVSGERSRATLTLEESPLSYLHRGCSPFKDTGNVLRSQGGLQRRRCRLIGIWDVDDGNGPQNWYQLSKTQSDRLLETQLWTSIESKEAQDAKKEAFLRIAEEIHASFTKADAVDSRKIMLKSSYES